MSVVGVLDKVRFHETAYREAKCDKCAGNLLSEGTEEVWRCPTCNCKAHVSCIFQHIRWQLENTHITAVACFNPRCTKRLEAHERERVMLMYVGMQDKVVAALQRRVTELEAELASERVRFEKERGAWVAERGAWAAERVTWAVDRAALLAENKALRAEVAQQQATIAMLMSTVERQQKEIQELKEHNRVLMQKIDDMARSHAADMAQLRQEHAADMAQLRKEHAAEMAQLRQEHAADMEQQRQKHAAEMASSKQSLESKIDALMAALQARGVLP